MILDSFLDSDLSVFVLNGDGEQGRSSAWIWLWARSAT
jgi:hypothetical protein